MLFAAGAMHLFFLYLQNIKDFSPWRILIFFILFLPLAAITIWHWCLIVFWNALWFSAMFWCFLESVIPGLSSGGGCRRAHAAVTECCSRWVFQQSSSSCYLPPTWCSILTMPAVNWGLPLTIFIQFVPILHLCCRETFVLFLEPFHISALLSFLLCSPLLMFLMVSPPTQKFIFILRFIPAAQCCWGRGCTFCLAVCVMPA